MSEKYKDKLRKIASGDTMTRDQASSSSDTHYALADEYQQSEGKSIKVEGTDTKTSVTVGPGRGSRVTQSDRGMDASTWKTHITDATANPSLARGVDSFEFNGETYSLTETARDGSPLVVRA
tara:strand:+ start:4676 stop:5041 length:366 start_codon:yes stop_codon:yes gene_type:complete